MRKKCHEQKRTDDEPGVPPKVNAMSFYAIIIYIE